MQPNKHTNERNEKTLAESIRKLEINISPSKDVIWKKPSALRVIDCVLSLNRKYDSVVLPRILNFEKNFPEILTVTDLISAMDGYESYLEFSKIALNYNDHRRSQILFEVALYLRNVIGDDKDDLCSLTYWAQAMRPRDYLNVKVKGFGIAGFQYMRMLFGADTSKPDVHVINWVEKEIGTKLSAIDTLELVEKVARHVGVVVRDLDTTIWEMGARSTAHVPKRLLPG